MNNDVLKVGSWNISKSLVRKLSDKAFVGLINKYDVPCLNECWVKCPAEFDLPSYEKKYVSRENYSGGGVVIFYKKWLSTYIDIVKLCVDCMIWFKIDKSIMPNSVDLYVCALYMPPDRNVFYRKYDCDVFDILQEQDEIFKNIGTVSVIGDLNGRAGLELDYILDDMLDRQLQDNIVFIDYVSDNNMPERQSEDTSAPNSFGRRIIELCKSSGLRICNGRLGLNSSKITFNNENGSSVIDYKLSCIEPTNMIIFDTI